MPLPLILGGIAAAAGLFGIAKGAESVSNNNEARELNERAQGIFEEAKENMEASKEAASQALSSLGAVKLEVWGKQMGRFVSLVERVKDVELEGQAFVDRELHSRISGGDLLEMKEISLKAGEVIKGGIQSLGAGALAGIASYGGAVMFASASTGTAITALSGVAATNATLAWFGGGSLAAGGLGIAGGTAVLGGIVAGPALAIGGAIMAAKSRKNLAEAKSNLAQAKRAAEEMDTASSMLNAIEMISKQFRSVILDLNGRMTYALNNLERSLIEAENTLARSFKFKFKRFIGKLFGRKVVLSYKDLNEEQRKQIHLSYQFAQAMKLLLETPILKEDGSLDERCEEALKPVSGFLEAAISR